MNLSHLNIRPAAAHERSSVLNVHLVAFGDEEGPVIAALVDKLLDDATAEPHLSLVAELNDEIVGHVLFTAAQIEACDALKGQLLAPLAVKSKYQAMGVGSQLVREGIARLNTEGADLVFVLGYPEYYSRFDFRPAGAAGFEAPYPIHAENSDAWMVHALSPDAISNHQGTVRCAESLNQPQYWQE